MNERLRKVDEIRGITLISMILYHFMWDLKYIAGIKMDWYTGLFGHVWQQSICISFILISGFCFNLGRHHLKRSLQVFICGAIITAVTLIVMPENRIVFGILTFIGSAGLIMIPLDKVVKRLAKALDEITLHMTLCIGGLLFFVVFYRINDGELNYILFKQMIPKYMCNGYLSTYIGFTDPAFYSTDYFSLLPWMFLYIVGYSVFNIIQLKCAKQHNKTVLSLVDRMKSGNCRPLEYIGNKTLIIYMLHQPVLYAVTLLIMKL